MVVVKKTRDLEPGRHGFVLAQRLTYCVVAGNTSLVC